MSIVRVCVCVSASFFVEKENSSGVLRLTCLAVCFLSFCVRVVFVRLSESSVHSFSSSLFVRAEKEKAQRCVCTLKEGMGVREGAVLFMLSKKVSAFVTEKRNEKS